MATISWQSSNIATRMHRVLDTDRSGGVSREELAALQKTQAGRALEDKDLDGYFAARDRADGAADGRLQRSELGPSGLFSPEVLTAMLDEISGASSADRGVADQFRFADDTLVRTAQARVFALMDQNKDGGVSAEELARVSDSGAGGAPDIVVSLDVDGDHRLSSHELAGTRLLDSENLASTLQKLQPGAGDNSASLNLAEWLMPQLDNDRDGALSLDEYQALPTGHPIDGAAGRRLFGRVDVNGDGKLSADELSGSLEGFGGSVAIVKGDTGLLLSGVMQQDDTSGDGALDAGELKAALGDAAGDALLSGFDADGDGSISAAELSAAAALRPDYYANQGLTAQLRSTEDPKGFRADLGTAAEQALHGLMWRALDAQVGALTGSEADRSPLTILRPPPEAASAADPAGSVLAPQTLAVLLDQQASPELNVVAPKLDPSRVIDEALDALIASDRNNPKTSAA